MNRGYFCICCYATLDIDFVFFATIDENCRFFTSTSSCYGFHHFMCQFLLDMRNFWATVKLQSEFKGFVVHEVLWTGQAWLMLEVMVKGKCSTFLLVLRFMPLRYKMKSCYSIKFLSCFLICCLSYMLQFANFWHLSTFFFRCNWMLNAWSIYTKFERRYVFHSKLFFFWRKIA